MKLPIDLETLGTQTWFKVLGGGAVVGAGAVGVTQLDVTGNGSPRVESIQLAPATANDDCRDVELDIEGNTMQVPVRTALLGAIDDTDDCDDSFAMDDAVTSADGPADVQPAPVFATASSDSPDATNDSLDNSAASVAQVIEASVDSVASPDSFDTPDSPATPDSPDWPDSPATPDSPDSPATPDSPDSFDSPDNSNGSW